MANFDRALKFCCVRARLIALASVIVGLAILSPPARQVFAKTTVGEVSQGLTCQCGCGLTVANCNHPDCSFAVPARQQIAEMIKQGMDRIQIVNFFRQKYGEKVLSAPTTEGFNLLAWVMPFAALLFGVALVLLMFGRWRRATPALPAGPDEALAQRVPVIDPRLRERLEKEVREHL